MNLTQKIVAGVAALVAPVAATTWVLYTPGTERPAALLSGLEAFGSIAAVVAALLIASQQSKAVQDDRRMQRRMQELAELEALISATKMHLGTLLAIIQSVENEGLIESVVDFLTAQGSRNAMMFDKTVLADLPTHEARTAWNTLVGDVDKTNMYLRMIREVLPRPPVPGFIVALRKSETFTREQLATLEALRDALSSGEKGNI